MSKSTAQTTNYEQIEKLEDEAGELENLLAEEYRYHMLRAEALKRELVRRDIEVE